MKRKNDDGAPDHPLEPGASGRHLRWQLARAVAPESCRWESVEGQWVSLTIVAKTHPTRIIVQHSDGRSQVVEAHHIALAIAKSWRT